jgi:hypothetical protein
LVKRLEKIPLREKRGDYRAATPTGKDGTIAELVEELKPILHGVWASYQGPGRNERKRCGLTGDFPSNDTLREIAKKALTVRIGRNPRDTIGYEFLGRLKFNIGGWEMLTEWSPRPASPALIKSTLATLRKRKGKPDLTTLLKRSRHK